MKNAIDRMKIYWRDAKLTRLLEDRPDTMREEIRAAAARQYHIPR